MTRVVARRAEPAAGGWRRALVAATTLPGGDLPHGLTPPLHLVEPWWQTPGPWLVLAAALLLGWWLLRAWRRRRLAAAPRPAPSPAAARTDRGGVLQAVHDLWQQHRHGDDLRPALADLSVLLRRHLAAGLPVAHRRPGLTALALASRSAPRVADLLRDLVRLQFGRRRPSGPEFDDVCRRAIDALAEEAGEQRARRPRNTRRGAGPRGRPAGSRRGGEEER